MVAFHCHPQGKKQEVKSPMDRTISSCKKTVWCELPNSAPTHLEQEISCSFWRHVIQTFISQSNVMGKSPKVTQVQVNNQPLVKAWIWWRRSNFCLQRVSVLSTHQTSTDHYGTFISLKVNSGRILPKKGVV